MAKAWFWFRAQYDRGDPQEWCTLDTSLRAAWDREWMIERNRQHHARVHPKRNWNPPPVLLSLLAIREPPELRRQDPELKKYLDAVLVIENNHPRR